MKNFERLKQDFNIRGFKFKSRAIITSHSSSSLSAPGQIDNRLSEYIKSYSHSGAAAFFLGETVVADGTEGGATHWGMGASCDGIEQEYAKLIDCTHDSGMLIFEQLSHFGGQTWAVPGATALAPSSIPQEISGLTPSPMTKDDILKVTDAYKIATKRAAQGGIHGVEIKCDQGKLLHQFISRRFNKRRDEYGGNLNNRLRLLKEIAEQCFEAADKIASTRPLLSLRLSLTHFADDQGFPSHDPELLEAISCISDWNVFDMLSFNLHTNSTYFGYGRAHPVQSRVTDRVFLLIDKVANASNLPVLYTGGVNHPSKAEWILGSTNTTFVGMTRSFIADPEMLQKAFRDETATIRPCIGCNQGCVGNTWEGRALSCTVNPAVGHNSSFHNQVVTSPTKPNVGSAQIAIVGTGPAGLEAAVELQSNGFPVVIFEKSNAIGGNLNLAGKLPQKEGYRSLVDYFRDQLLSSDLVELNLNTAPEKSNLENFQYVVDARGAVENSPYVRKSGVWQLTDVEAVRRNRFWADKRVLIVDENWLNDPLAIALYIEQQGGRVQDIVTTREFVGMGLDVVNLTTRLASLRSSLSRPARQFHSFTTVDGVDPDGRVIIKDLCTLKTRRLSRIDAIVSVNSPSRRPFGDSDLVGNDKSTLVIGDAAGPRGVEFALRDGKSIVHRIMKGDKL